MSKRKSEIERLVDTINSAGLLCVTDSSGVLTPSVGAYKTYVHEISDRHYKKCWNSVDKRLKCEFCDAGQEILEAIEIA